MVYNDHSSVDTFSSLRVAWVFLYSQISVVEYHNPDSLFTWIVYFLHSSGSFLHSSGLFFALLGWFCTLRVHFCTLRVYFALLGWFVALSGWCFCWVLKTLMFNFIANTSINGFICDCFATIIAAQKQSLSFIHLHFCLRELIINSTDQQLVVILIFFAWYGWLLLSNVLTEYDVLNLQAFKVYLVDIQQMIKSRWTRQ